MLVARAELHVDEELPLCSLWLAKLLADGVAGDGVSGQGEARLVLGLGRIAGLARELRLRPGLDRPRSEAEVPPSSSSPSESLLASALESGDRVSPTLPALPRLSSE
jgi:hypothetical protein